MGVVQKFCCCCNTRNGSIFAGFYSLVSSCVFVGVLLMRYVGFKLIDSSRYHTIIISSSLAVFALHIITSIILIIAAFKDKKTLFYPWLTTATLAVLEGTGMFIWLVVIDIRQTGKVPPWELGLLCSHVANFSFTCYCMVCVFSQLQDLVQGKGTAAFYRRQEIIRRQAVGEVVENLPPFSVFEERLGGLDAEPPHYLTLESYEQPPPYSEVVRETSSDDVSGSGAGTPGRHVTRIHVIDRGTSHDPREPIGAVSLEVVPPGIPPPDYESVIAGDAARAGTPRESVTGLVLSAFSNLGNSRDALVTNQRRGSQSITDNHRLRMTRLFVTCTSQSGER